MTAQKLEVLSLITTTTSNKDDEFSIPMDISDIINICKVYNDLGYQIQNQMETILDLGVQESIKSGIVKQASLPHIKSFLKAVCSNAYFGDAIFQAEECIDLIKEYEEKNKSYNSLSVN
jgi:hypothetical protein